MFWGTVVWLLGWFYIQVFCKLDWLSSAWLRQLVWAARKQVCSLSWMQWMVGRVGGGARTWHHRCSPAPPSAWKLRCRGYQGWAQKPWQRGRGSHRQGRPGQPSGLRPGTRKSEREWNMRIMYHILFRRLNFSSWNWTVWCFLKITCHFDLLFHWARVRQLSNLYPKCQIQSANVFALQQEWAHDDNIDNTLHLLIVSTVFHYCGLHRINQDKPWVIVKRSWLETHI